MGSGAVRTPWDAATFALRVLTPFEYWQILEEQATRSEAALFDRLLARVPDLPPAPGDELSNSARQADKALQPIARQTYEASNLALEQPIC